MQITIDLPQGIELDDAIRQHAESKARESYLMELLRYGSISTGYAAQNLNLSRPEILNLEISRNQMIPQCERLARGFLIRERDARTIWRTIGIIFI